MNKRKLLIIITIVVTIIAYTSSYWYFTKYLPKSLIKVAEVKGLRSSNDYTFPYPRDAQKIGSINTREYIQTTFQSQTSPSDIQQFYRNVLGDKKWILEYEGNKDEVLTTKYKKEEMLITIVSQQTKDINENITTVSIELLFDR